jgi:hypothetical protein
MDSLWLNVKTGAGEGANYTGVILLACAAVLLIAAFFFYRARRIKKRKANRGRAK